MRIEFMSEVFGTPLGTSRIFVGERFQYLEPAGTTRKGTTWKTT